MRSPDYPRRAPHRLKNPLLAADRARKRQELLAATERDLASIATAMVRSGRSAAAAIGLRVGKVLGRYKVGKHFTIAITDHALRYARRAAITAEAASRRALCRRTSVPAAAPALAETVRAYKRLAEVERTFRSLKTVDLHGAPFITARPTAFGRTCSLPAGLLRRMAHAPGAQTPAVRRRRQGRRRGAPRLVVAPAQRSLPRAEGQRLTADRLPVHSFQTLLADLATLTQNQGGPWSRWGDAGRPHQPTPLQQRAFERSAYPLACSQYSAARATALAAMAHTTSPRPGIV